MMKSKFKLLSLVVSIVITMFCLQENLQAMKKSINKFDTISSFQGNYEEIEQLVEDMNDSRIVYKNGQVIFYPNPNIKKVEDQLFTMAIWMFICSITIILIPISFILLIVEMFYLWDLSKKRELAKSITPHIILDDFGIKIKGHKTSLTDIRKITKEEITKYVNGHEQSKKNIVHVYDKYLSKLFELDDQDKYIEMSFDNLIKLIYHFLERSKNEFTINMQKTTISENTINYPVYIYR